MTLISAFDPTHTVFASTCDVPDAHLDIQKYYRLHDVNRNTPVLCLRLVAKVFWIFIKERPSVVVSTGALPGLLCILIGRLFFAKTLWIDSIANVERLSMCGRLARHISTVTLSQWPDLSDPKAVLYQGAVL